MAAQHPPLDRSRVVGLRLLAPFYMYSARSQHTLPQLPEPEVLTNCHLSVALFRWAGLQCALCTADSMLRDGPQPVGSLEQPITSLSRVYGAGLSEAMLGSGPWQLGEQGQRYMKTIKTSSMHLANLINDILDAAASGKGKLAIKLEKVSSCPQGRCPSTGQDHSWPIAHLQGLANSCLLRHCSPCGHPLLSVQHSLWVLARSVGLPLDPYSE